MAMITGRDLASAAAVDWLYTTIRLVLLPSILGALIEGMFLRHHFAQEYRLPTKEWTCTATYKERAAQGDTWVIEEKCASYSRKGEF
jgi:hypothetical protein